MHLVNTSRPGADYDNPCDPDASYGPLDAIVAATGAAMGCFTKLGGAQIDHEGVERATLQFAGDYQAG